MTEDLILTPSLRVIYDDFTAQMAGVFRVPLDRLRGKPGMATVDAGPEYYDQIQERKERFYVEYKRQVDYALKWYPIFQARVRVRRYRRFKGIRRPRFARRDR